MGRACVACGLALLVGCATSYRLDDGDAGRRRDGGSIAGRRDGGRPPDGSGPDAGRPPRRDGGVDGGVDAGPACEPVPEACNGLDDDCDGRVDERGGPPLCPAGACAGGVCLDGVDDAVPIEPEEPDGRTRDWAGFREFALGADGTWIVTGEATRAPPSDPAGDPRRVHVVTGLAPDGRSVRWLDEIGPVASCTGCLPGHEVDVVVADDGRVVHGGCAYVEGIAGCRAYVADRDGLLFTHFCADGRDSTVVGVAVGPEERVAWESWRGCAPLGSQLFGTPDELGGQWSGPTFALPRDGSGAPLATLLEFDAPGTVTRAGLPGPVVASYKDGQREWDFGVGDGTTFEIMVPHPSVGVVGAGRYGDEFRLGETPNVLADGPGMWVSQVGIYGGLWWANEVLLDRPGTAPVPRALGLTPDRGTWVVATKPAGVRARVGDGLSVQDGTTFLVVYDDLGYVRSVRSLGMGEPWDDRIWVEDDGTMLIPMDVTGRASPGGVYVFRIVP